MIARQLSFDEIRTLPLSFNDDLVQIIYEQVYEKHTQVIWKDIGYQAPETPAGWAARNCQHLVDEIRRLEIK